MMTSATLVQQYNRDKHSLIGSLKEKRIVVLTGGFSEEKLASDETAEAVYTNLIKQGFNVELLDPAQVDFVRELSPLTDIVFNCIHGEFGESGHVSAILDYYKIPYTFSNSYVSAISMDKLLLKSFAAQLGIPVLQDDFYGAVSDLSPPVIMKSSRGGGSIGMELTDIETPNKRGFFKEQFIKGVPYSVGVLEGAGRQIQVLAPVRVELDGLPFYTKEAKYGENGASVRVVPEHHGVDEIKQFSERLALKLDFNGAIRIDYIQAEGRPYLLEVNNVPGIYRGSNMAVSAEACGLAFEDLLTYLMYRADFYKFGQENMRYTNAL